MVNLKKRILCNIEGKNVHWPGWCWIILNVSFFFKKICFKCIFSNFWTLKVFSISLFVASTEQKKSLFFLESSFKTKQRNLDLFPSHNVGEILPQALRLLVFTKHLRTTFLGVFLFTGLVEKFFILEVKCGKTIENELPYLAHIARPGWFGFLSGQQQNLVRPTQVRYTTWRTSVDHCMVREQQKDWSRSRSNVYSHLEWRIAYR